MKPYQSGILEILDNLYTMNYINPAPGFTLQQTAENRHEMRGHFHNIESKAFTKVRSSVLNSASANILFNEVAMAYLAESGILDLSEGPSALGKVVVTHFSIHCKSMITERSDKTFRLTCERCSDDRGRTLFSGQVDLSGGAFIMEGRGIIMPRDPHNLKTLNAQLA